MFNNIVTHIVPANFWFIFPHKQFYSTLYGVNSGSFYKLRFTFYKKLTASSITYLSISKALFFWSALYLFLLVLNFLNKKLGKSIATAKRSLQFPNATGSFKNTPQWKFL